MNYSRFYISVFLLLLNFSISAQLNMDSISNISYNQDLNDIWGYVAPDDTEYALVGLINGVSIVNLSDPSNPVENAFVNGVESNWRDIKTYDHYAYVTNETGDGLMVIDLSNLPDSVSSFNWEPDIPLLGGALSAIHNIYIDEFGYGYLTGSNLNNGGLIYIDLFSDPSSPTYVDAGPPIYSHDVYVKDQIAYSSEIYNGTLTIYDVSDKSATALLGQTSTPFEFTHNAWVSDNGNYMFTTDEKNDAPVTAYDIQDFTDIKEVDQFRPAATLGTGVIPHNVFVKQDWLVISQYTDGVKLVDASRPDNLVEVGDYDTFPTDTIDFLGAWGVYPYLPSGLILVSDINFGLFVLEPFYVHACHLQGNVKDAITGADINDAQITIQNTNLQASTDPLGVYKTGYATAGTYEVTVSRFPYESQTAQAVLENGVLTIIDFQLTPLTPFELNIEVTDGDDGVGLPFAKIKVEGEAFSDEFETDANGNLSISTFYEGDYTFYTGVWGHLQDEINNINITEANNSINIELEKGIEDGFELDLGWTAAGIATGPSSDIMWERDIPLPFNPGPPDPNVTGDYFFAPPLDNQNDIGTFCWTTGNVSGFEGVLFHGQVTLTSPAFDLTSYNSPHVAYDSWYMNIEFNPIFEMFEQGQTPLNVLLTNGIDTVQIDTIFQPSGPPALSPPSWQANDIDLTGLISFTENMQVIFDLNVPDLTMVGRLGFTEASLDFFQVYEGQVVSTTSLSENFELKAFPNPSNSVIQINYELEEKAMLLVHNTLGQLIEQIVLSPHSNRIEVGRKWIPGIYTATIITEQNASQSIKLIKSN